MNLNDTVWELDGQSGNFAWFVKRYVEKQVKEAVTPKLPTLDECMTALGVEHGGGVYNGVYRDGIEAMYDLACQIINPTTTASPPPGAGETPHDIASAPDTH